MRLGSRICLCLFRRGRCGGGATRLDSNVLDPGGDQPAANCGGAGHGPILVVQVVLGWCLGVIYYSSLYYSMDAGDTKGEHAGVHEAAIGVGIFVGPAIGAASIWAFPAHPESGVWGVALVLVIGLGGLVYLRRANGRKTAVPGSPAM